eukprot:8567465-Pyramimonas_sp.AAC.1
MAMEVDLDSFLEQNGELSVDGGGLDAEDEPAEHSDDQIAGLRDFEPMHLELAVPEPAPEVEPQRERFPQRSGRLMAHAREIRDKKIKAGLRKQLNDWDGLATASTITHRPLPL